MLSLPLLLPCKPYRLSSSHIIDQHQLLKRRQRSVLTQVPTRSAQHAHIIIRWVLPVVSALIAICTVISLPTVAMVPETPQLLPLLIKLYSQPRKGNTRLRHPRPTLESALHVVILTTLQTCARTGL